MASDNFKPAGKQKRTTPESRAKSSEEKERCLSAKIAPRRQVSEAVRNFAEKRKIEEIAGDDSDEDTRKQTKRYKKPAPNYDDFVPREMPLPRDCSAIFAANSTAHLTWAAPIVFPQLPSIRKSEPSQADASSKANGKRTIRRKGERAVSPSHPFLSQSDDNFSASRPEQRKTTTKKANTVTTPEVDNISPSKIFFVEFPAEIRMAIYRHLLVAENPIQVRQGWSALYPRNRPCLETSILRVSRQVRNEAISVLYGENVFLYLLRETAPLPVADNSGSPADDPFLEYDGESDPEYDKEVPVTAATGDPKVEIDIRRFGHKFRRIKILAEPNRHEMGYLLSMANAISVFRDLKPIKCRIHTIEIEVTPKRDSDTGDLTFLDFFEKSSAVMKELRGLSCQFIEIIVNTSRDVQERIKVNQKYAAIVRRALRGEHPLLKDDKAMQKYTSEEAGAAQGQLDNLQSLIRNLWNRQNNAGRNSENSEQEAEVEEAVDWLWEQDYD